MYYKFFIPFLSPFIPAKAPFIGKLARFISSGETFCNESRLWACLCIHYENRNHMKTRTPIFALLALLFAMPCENSLSAQTTAGSIAGTVVDGVTGRSMYMADFGMSKKVLKDKGAQRRGTSSDEEQSRVKMDRG